MDPGLGRMRRDICLEQQWRQQSTLAHTHVVFPSQVCWVQVTHPGIRLTYAVKSQILLLTNSRLESLRVNSHWVNQATDSHKVDQRREERNQVRQSREQRWDQEKPRMKHEYFRQGRGWTGSEPLHLWSHKCNFHLQWNFPFKRTFCSTKEVKVVTKLITSRN